MEFLHDTKSHGTIGESESGSAGALLIHFKEERAELGYGTPDQGTLRA